MRSALGVALAITSDTPASAPPLGTPGPATRSVETPYGLVEVPTNPQRVVALGEEFMLADLLDLGIRPIASTASASAGFLGLDRFDVSDIETLSNTAIDLEGITELRPDMLLVYTGMAEDIGVDLLNQIAPTVAVDPGDYRAAYVSLAAAFGREAIAETRLEEYDSAANAAGQALDAAARSVSVVTIYPGANIAVWVGGSVDLPQALLDMGFRLEPDATTLPPTSSQSRSYVSLEQLELLTGDDLMMLQSKAIDGEAAAVTEVTSSDIWQLIPAVAAGRVHTIDRLGYPGVPGRLALVQELRTVLAR